MLFSSRFDQRDVEMERGVILEEIGKGAGDGCEEVMDRQQSEDAGGSALV
jgi:predicted Zn-dependent peptidase